MSSTRPDPHRLRSRNGSRQECREERPSPSRGCWASGTETAFGDRVQPMLCPDRKVLLSPTPRPSPISQSHIGAHNGHSVFERTPEGCTLPGPCCAAQALNQRKGSGGTCCAGGLRLPLSPARVSTLGPLPPLQPPVLRPALCHPRHCSTTSETWASGTSLESGNPGSQLGRGHCPAV